jgi:DegV family protein with EDD domain
MTVAVVTDGAASLPADLAAAMGVTVVPIEVTVGGRPLASEGEGPRLADVLGHLDAGVRTASPGPGRFAAAMRARSGGDGVLVLTLAASMSGTYRSALLAARDVGGEVSVLDTGTAAGAQGLVVLAAAGAALEGRPLVQVRAAAERAAARVRLVATVSTLDYLVRGGRLPAFAGRAGSRLGAQPMFEFRAGRIRPLRPSFSRTAAKRRILDAWRTSRERDAALHVAALHACADEEANELLDAVAAEVTPATSFMAEFDVAMATHTGPGVLGLAWWWDPPER